MSVQKPWLRRGITEAMYVAAKPVEWRDTQEAHAALADNDEGFDILLSLSSLQEYMNLWMEADGLRVWLARGGAFDLSDQEEREYFQSSGNPYIRHMYQEWCKARGMSAVDVAALECAYG